MGHTVLRGQHRTSDVCGLFPITINNNSSSNSNTTTNTTTNTHTRTHNNNNNNNNNSNASNSNHTHNHIDCYPETMRTGRLECRNGADADGQSIHNKNHDKAKT